MMDKDMIEAAFLGLSHGQAHAGTFQLLATQGQRIPRLKKKKKKESCRQIQPPPDAC